MENISSLWKNLPFELRTEVIKKFDLIDLHNIYDICMVAKKDAGYNFYFLQYLTLKDYKEIVKNTCFINNDYVINKLMKSYMKNNMYLENIFRDINYMNKRLAYRFYGGDSRDYYHYCDKADRIMSPKFDLIETVMTRANKNKIKINKLIILCNDRYNKYTNQGDFLNENDDKENIQTLTRYVRTYQRYVTDEMDRYYDYHNYDNDYDY